uniref:Uncharacterized protein n=1 Tax=Timema tahoe TaxID=61484 RepID=A0A7R9IF99_9NEOP|nr:unnamed protein product [Timema tahoe]
MANCGCIFKTSGNTSNLKAHMDKIHPALSKPEACPALGQRPNFSTSGSGTSSAAVLESDDIEPQPNPQHHSSSHLPQAWRRLQRIETCRKLYSYLSPCKQLQVKYQVIDACAFRVYGHWVKKGEGQNRAALFENMPKTELKYIYVNKLSR